MMGRSDEELRELRRALELTGSTSPFLALRPGGDPVSTGAATVPNGGATTARAPCWIDRFGFDRRARKLRARPTASVRSARLLTRQGQLALARQLLDEAIQRYAAQGKSPSRAAALGQLGDVALSEGELVEAERLYAEGLAVWRKIDHGYWTGRFLTRQARLALMRGQLEVAESEAEEGRRLLEISNSPAASAWSLTVLAEVKATAWGCRQRRRSCFRRHRQSTFSATTHLVFAKWHGSRQNSRWVRRDSL